MKANTTCDQIFECKQLSNCSQFQCGGGVGWAGEGVQLGFFETEPMTRKTFNKNVKKNLCNHDRNNTSPPLKSKEVQHCTDCEL